MKIEGKEIIKGVDKYGLSTYSLKNGEEIDTYRMCLVDRLHASLDVLSHFFDMVEGKDNDDEDDFLSATIGRILIENLKKEFERLDDFIRENLGNIFVDMVTATDKNLDYGTMLGVSFRPVEKEVEND